MPWGLFMVASVMRSKEHIPNRSRIAAGNMTLGTQSQKPTETGTETLDTDTACGIMALSQTTGHGIYSSSRVDEESSQKKGEP